MSWSFYTSNGTPRANIDMPGGVRYTYSNTTTDSDPGNGFIRTNSSDVSSTTQIFIDNVDIIGTNQTAWYETFDDSIADVKGHLYIQTGSSTALILGVTAVSSATGYYKLSCNYISGLRPNNNSEVSVFFAPAGPTGAFSNSQTIDAKTANYTLANSDAGKVITMDSSSALTLTVNSSLGLSVGQRIDIIQLGTGQVTVSASSTTVNATPGLKLRARYSGASLLCTASNTYILAGDLTN